jgi:acetyl coenzyme A synthetase (ADP forming)-like protein
MANLIESPTVPEPVTIRDIVLRDGSTLALRPGRAGDADALLQFFAQLSPQSRYQRFFGFPVLDADRARRLLATCPPTTDAPEAMALVGEVSGRMVAFAGFYRTNGQSDRAEVAFAIADALQGRGIGTRMLEQLSEIARRRGIRTFDASVLAGNRRMLDVFTDCGFSVTTRQGGGVVEVTIGLEPTASFVAKSAERAQHAATASMKAFFQPASVAVIGANRTRGKIGSEILHNLIASGFTGAIIPVHPSAEEIEGLRAWPRVSDIPQAIDLAVVAVPAAHVLAAVDDCLAKGVRGICVISAGFGESGPEGREREAALLAKIRSAGCRLIGPNCMGLLNTDPAYSLNATFAPVYPPAGGVAMSTQSGALGLAILDYARRLNIGISSFVSVGNKTDVSSNDLIQYWSEDPNTSVILLYLESFGNPRKFSEIARRVGRTKPIVAVKAGRSVSGARAASSHTGALAGSDKVVDALFQQAGVIRTETLEEMFDVAALLAHQPIPRGKRVAILTNAGGPGILAADACAADGLELPVLSAATRAELRQFLPPAASVTNPVDMLASAPAEHFARALAIILKDENVDSVLTIFIPPLVTEPDAVAAAIAGVAPEANGKPILGIFMRAEGAPAALANIPSYAFPESAARALARVTHYGAWRATAVGDVPAFADVRADDLRTLVDEVLARGGGWLTTDEARRLLAAAGIPSAPTSRAANADEAVAAAEQMGYPVALKVVGPALLHKTERNAVRLNLTDAASVRAVARQFETEFAGEMSGIIVQRMVPGGVEMLVGAIEDPTFGPIVVCGSGGVLVELLGDSAFRLHPLTDRDASEMVGELKGAALLRGFRGAPPVDEPALRETILRVSALLSICPEIQELDLNPVKVLRSGACVVDARVRIDRPCLVPRSRRVEY